MHHQPKNHYVIFLFREFTDSWHNMATYKLCLIPLHSILTGFLRFRIYLTQSMHTIQHCYYALLCYNRSVFLCTYSVAPQAIF